MCASLLTEHQDLQSESWLIIALGLKANAFNDRLTSHAESVEGSIFHRPLNFDRLILNLSGSQLISMISTHSTIILNLIWNDLKHLPTIYVVMKAVTLTVAGGAVSITSGTTPCASMADFPDGFSDRTDEDTWETNRMNIKHPMVIVAQILWLLPPADNAWGENPEKASSRNFLWIAHPRAKKTFLQWLKKWNHA